MNTVTRKSALHFNSVLGAIILATTTGMTMVAQITLSGDQEAPPVNSAAKGSGTITVNEDKSISGSVKTSGLNGNAAHIHEGAPGNSGPVLISLKKSGDTWSVPPGTKLTDKQYESYQAGNLYVNVHSAKHKDGEIRGQIRP